MIGKDKMFQITEQYNHITESTGFLLKNCLTYNDDMGVAMIKSHFVKFNSFDDWKKFYDEVKEL